MRKFIKPFENFRKSLAPELNGAATNPLSEIKQSKPSRDTELVFKQFSKGMGQTEQGICLAHRWDGTLKYTEQLATITNYSGAHNGGAMVKLVDDFNLAVAKSLIDSKRYIDACLREWKRQEDTEMSDEQAMVKIKEQVIKVSKRCLIIDTLKPVNIGMEMCLVKRW